VLFARADSVYKTLPACDVWDIQRDARNWQGGSPVVAHPPCRGWSRLRSFAHPRIGERDLAFFALDAVRTYGGVLEHPAKSAFWDTARLPKDFERDRFGGWTLPIYQQQWGHRAQKKTWLYIVGVPPYSLPDMPFVLGEASHTCGLWSGRDKSKARPEIGKAEREHTPLALAEWLVMLARASNV
jgi:hypothetical protein